MSLEGAASSSAIRSTATTTFSSRQMMLLSREAPWMMPLAARSRSAVSSTTTGGFPGPAATTLLPLSMASWTTAGPPVTARSWMPGCFINAWAVSIVGSATPESRFSGMPAPTRASLTRRTSHDAVDLAKGWTLKTTELPAAIMPMALRDDRLGDVGHRRDGADDAPGCPLEEGEAFVARPGVGRQVLGARGLFDGEAVFLAPCPRPGP